MIDPLEDGISKVELLTHMGDDLMVVNAARVSYDVESHWGNSVELTMFRGHPTQQTEYLVEGDKRLLHYLATHNHWTPFSHPQIQFRIKMPLFVAREWYRHTIGLTRNEVSRRYVNKPPEFYIPKVLRNKPGEGMSKQGSQGVNSFSGMYVDLMSQDMGKNILHYNMMINDGVAPEQARIVLPVGTYTEFIETASLYAYSRLAGLRLAPDAQAETRAFAQAVSEMIQPLFPVSWKELVHDS